MDKNVLFLKKSNQSISSFDNLCKVLGLKDSEILSTLCMDDQDKYQQQKLPKKSGGERLVYNPHYKLRKIQRRINSRIFSGENQHVTWPAYIYGSISNQIFNGDIVNKDYVACVANHCLAQSVLKIDIEDFYDNISEEVVFDIFNDFFKYPKDVSSILARVCCFKGFLVQGALTSSYIANLCLYDVEPTLVRKLKRKGLVYTRLLDDITVSSKKIRYDFGYSKKIIFDALNEKELPVNSKKVFELYQSSTSILIHGLRIAFSQPRLPKEEISRIRASVKNIEKIASKPKYRLTYSYRKQFFKCLGRVNKLKRLGHSQHKNLVKRLNSIRPKPSHKDIKKCDDLIQRLTREYSRKNSHYWYKRRFYLAQDKINLVSESYPNMANKMREKLKGYHPTYESY